MSQTALSQAREDARFRIHNYVMELAAGEGDDQDSQGLFAISWEHRQLAICRLLQDGDPMAFQLGLRRSALTWLHLLEKIAKGMQVSPLLRMGSKWDSLSCAIAAGDMELAKQIAERFPAVPDLDREYVDEYMPLAMMSRMVIAPDDREGIQALCEQWQQAGDGSSIDDISLWLALAHRDMTAFKDAFSVLIAYRRDQMAAYRKLPGNLPSTAATEGAIYIDGLAMLQLAHSAGMMIDKAYSMCPKLSRVTFSRATLPKNHWTLYD